MIVVKVELHSAVTGKVSEIGRAYFANIGGTRTRGDYGVAVCRRGTSEVPSTDWSCGTGPLPTREGKVENYPRLSYSVWRLIIRGLRACFPEER